MWNRGGTRQKTCSMKRVVQPELLDELPPHDRRAVRSRRDLLRINAWMGNAPTMARVLQAALPGSALRQIVELGAGDGEFTLRVAGHLGARNSASPHHSELPASARQDAVPAVPPGGGTPDTGCRSALLLDRLPLIRPETERRFEQLNWKIRVVTADVFHFYENGAITADAVIANLFLHHFTDEQLRRLFRFMQAKARVYIALEPRRSRLTLFASCWLWLIGCNSVTRHDARLSVQAGFNRRELSALWPASSGWELTERPAGFFSHLFVARRAD